MRLQESFEGVPGAEAACHAPLAYAVPYEWGALYVTEQADQQYGIQPIVPEQRGLHTTFMDRETASTDDSSLPSIDILLCAPQEAPRQLDMPNHVSAKGSVNQERGTVEMLVTSGLTWELADLSVGSELRNFILMHGGVENEETIEYGTFMVQGQHMPYHVYKERSMVHKITHQIGDPLSEASVDYMQYYLRQRRAQKMDRRVRAAGGLGILGAVGAGAMTILAETPYNAAAVGIAAAAGFAFRRAALGSRGYAATLLEHELKIAERTRPVKSMIYDDLHRTYCLGHDPM